MAKYFCISSPAVCYDDLVQYYVMKKLLESAIANAENNNNSDIDKLSVKSVIVNQGMRLKRMKARARGRADRIIKPTCHIEIILVEETN